jgi:hypothetical protein
VPVVALFSVPSDTQWHLEDMTDTAEPDPAADATTSPASETAAESTTTKRPSLWHRSNRTNRIAALVFGAVGGVLAVALIFVGGVLIGAEFGDSEDHHRSGTSHEEGGGHHEGDGSGSEAEHHHEGDGGGSESAVDRDGGGATEQNGDRGEPGQQQPSEAPDSPAPGKPKP